MTFKRDGDRNATFGVRTRRRSKRDGRRSKLRTAVYPPRMAPIGLKLGENTFQTIPDVSFFDVKKNCQTNFKDFWWLTHDFLVLEKLEHFKHHHRILLEKWPRLAESSSLYVPWRRGSRTIEGFFRWFWIKTDLQFLLDGSYDGMIIWSHDIMVLWYYDIMTIRYHNLMTIRWYDGIMTC